MSSMSLTRSNFIVAKGRSSLVFLVYTLFFLSGASALVYEVAWVRILGLVLGNTVAATSVVLGIFLGCLALGAVLGGKVADRVKDKQLLYYGCAEIGIGVTAPAVTRLLFALPDFLTVFNFVNGQAWWIAPARTAICCVWLVVPITLMGATLPLLAKYLSRLFVLPGQMFAALYGLNTMGAAAGALFACFAGFAWLGINGTVMLAASINAAIGILASVTSLWISQRKPPEVVAISALEPDSDHAVTMPDEKTPLVILCVLAAMSGFCALAYEVLWSRLLCFYTTSSTYAFTIMVSTFLLGLVLGSLIYHSLLCKPGRSFSDELTGFALIQYAVGISCLGSLALTPLAALFVSAGATGSGDIFLNPGTALIVQLAVGLCFISLPATVIGISFPMLGGLAAHRRADLGESIGYVYGANTMGCVAGSLLAGLVAVPLISSYKSFLIVVLLSVLTGACALLGARTFSWKKQLVFAGLPVLACAFLVGGLNNPLPRLLASVGGNKLLASGEDVTGLVTVFERAGQRDLNINGVCYASTVMSGKRYMRMLGHLPMFLKEHPNEVLNICFGTGTTAGAISTHPDLHRLDIVELSPLVLADAGFFSLANNNVLDDSRAVAQVNDGRNFLLLSNKKYDVITFEPPPPCEAGVVNLYTTNFYALARRHLKPGGILCQWVPMHLQSSTLWKMMIKSADKEFRQVSVWDSGDGEAVIICSDQSLSFDLVRLQQKIDSSTALRFNLQEVGFERASSLVATLLLSPEEVTSLVAGYQPVTDDSPALEFFLPYIGPTMKVYELSGSRLNWRSMMTAGTFTAACVEELEAQHQALEHARKAGTADLTEPMRRELLTRSLELCPNNRYYSWLWSRISASPRVAAP